MTAPNSEYRRQLARVIGLDQLRCLNCRYDFRGQEGEQRRCPECGRINSIEEISRRHDQTTAVSPKLENTASLCAVPTMAMTLACVLLPIPGIPGSFVTYWLAIACFVWIVAAVIFGAVVKFSVGWIQVCLLYSAQTILIFGTIVISIVAVGLSIWIFQVQSGNWAILAACPIGGFIIGAVLVLGRFSGLRSPYFLGRARLRAIQAALDTRERIGFGRLMGKVEPYPTKIISRENCVNFL